MATVDLVHLEPVAGGLAVHAGARELNYPSPADVRVNVVYGYALDRTGLLDPDGAEVPEPVLVVRDRADGLGADFTVSDVAEDSRNTVYVRPLGGEAWAQAAVLTGAGTATAALGNGSWWTFVLTESGGGKNLSRPLTLTVSSAPEAGGAEIRRVLRARLLSAPGLAGLLHTPDAAYYGRMPETAALPCAVFREMGEEAKDGGREFRFEFVFYARSEEDARRLAELGASGLAAGGFVTAGWSARVARCPERRSLGEIAGRAGVYGAALDCRIFAYQTGGWVSLAAEDGGVSVDLPPPSELAPVLELRRQASGRAVSGEKYVYDRGAEPPRVTLRFAALNAQEKAALALFFHGTAGGMQHAFRYTDSAGSVAAVRFTKAELSFVRQGEGAYSAELPLEMV